MSFDAPTGPASAFGGAAVASDAVAQAESMRLFDVARHRFIKAVAALGDGEPDEADKWLRRAARMPYDHRARVYPACAAAAMTLSDMLFDAMQVAQHGDASWAQAAAQVAAGDGPGVPHLMRALQEIRDDYELRHAERRVVDGLLHEHAPGPSLFQVKGLTADEVADLLREAAQATDAYVRTCLQLKVPLAT